jgi:cell wall-associated NlpC family hydrolase
MRSGTTRRIGRHVAVSGLALGLCVSLTAPALAHAHKGPSRRAVSAAAAQEDATNLDEASAAIEQEALASGAIHHAPRFTAPAKILLASVDALTRLARRQDPRLVPTDTRPVMGAVPVALSHKLKHHPKHHRVRATHTLLPFVHGLADGGSAGIGMHKKHAHSLPALFQPADGRYVDPHLPTVAHPTIGEVAVRAALKQLGQPYVWAAAGPVTYDCSGLVQWAYAHAGIGLAHFTGDQWNEGRMIPSRDALPGDLILFGNPTFHVGMYLGAGWMVNAPYTGQYVNVVPVPSGVAGVIRP